MNQQLRKAIIKTLVYSDLFGYPLTVEEVKLFLIEYEFSNLHELKRVISELKQIEVLSNFVFLKGRKDLVEERKQRNLASERKLERAKLVTRVLKLISWIKMVAVTGEVAAGNAKEESDVDMLLIASGNRIWLTRFLSLLFLQLTGRRVHVKGKKFKNRVCLNMFISDNDLEQPQNLFVANEIARMKILWEKENMDQRFFSVNKWIVKYLPNLWEKTKTSLKEQDVTFQRKRKSLFGVSSFFDKLELIACKFQLRRFPANTEPENLLVGHPINHKKRILKRYQKNLRKFEIGNLRIKN